MQLKKLSAAALGALAMMSAAPAMADMIDFESLTPDIYGGMDMLHIGAYDLTVLDSPAGGGGLAGVVGNGADPDQCSVISCPTGNNSFFYMGVNDGSLKVTRTDNQAFRLNSVDYAFLPPIEGLQGYSYGQLTVVALKADGSAVSANYDFPLLVNGHSPFTGAALSHDFGNTAYSSVTIGACLFDGNSCVNPAGNQAQFVIDNLSVAAVPEPETYALMGLGLGLIGLLSRRRAQPSASITA